MSLVREREKKKQNALKCSRESSFSHSAGLPLSVILFFLILKLHTPLFTDTKTLGGLFIHSVGFVDTPRYYAGAAIFTSFVQLLC